MAKFRILVVDDEENIRRTVALILRAAGYEVSTAEHGFDALLQLKLSDAPDLIISDLNMPHMSGFELLSVVRRRFPKIAVIATSGAYNSGAAVPGGVIADGFHAKVDSDPATLLAMVAALLAAPTERMIKRHTDSAPVWIPRNGRDSTGTAFVVVTCPDCLRSFPLSVLHEDLQEVQETDCLFCPTKVRYIIDFSRGVVSPKESRVAKVPGAWLGAGN
jgi:CheY-like chemotaxis protein